MLNQSSLTTNIKISLLTLPILSVVVNMVIPGITSAQTTIPMFRDLNIDGELPREGIRVTGMSGGRTHGSQIAGRTSTLTGPCTGYVDVNPKHILTLESKFDNLMLVVTSPQDTTLIVRGPGGTWCSDDYNGKNPGLIGEWLPGKYQIWIGSYKQGESFPYTLQMTEMREKWMSMRLMGIFSLNISKNIHV